MDEGEWVVRYSPVVAVPAAIILVVNLLAVSAAGVRAAQGSGSDLCVAISGGTVSNATVLDVAADGGVAIADASGGTGNAAFLPDNSTDNTGNNDNDNDNNGNNNNNNNDSGNDHNSGNDNENGNNNNNSNDNRNNDNNNGNNDNDNDNNGNNTNNNNNDGNRNGGVGTAQGGDASNNVGAGNEQGAVNNTDGTNVNAAVAIIAADWTAEPVRALEARLLQTETASASNGGVATASADGGVVSIQDINSGGNAGNAIAVGDTVCAEGSFAAPAGGNAGGGNAGGGNVSGGGNAGGGRGGGQVRSLPNTGVGVIEDGTSESLLLALGALGLMGLSVLSHRDRRVVRAGGR